MAIITLTNTQTISSVQRTNNLGQCFSRGGIVNGASALTDTVYYGEVASGFTTGNNGAVILIGVDGSYIYIHATVSGIYLPFKHIGMTNVATVNDASGNEVTVTSSATWVTWFGGEA